MIDLARQQPTIKPGGRTAEAGARAKPESTRSRVSNLPLRVRLGSLQWKLTLQLGALVACALAAVSFVAVNRATSLARSDAYDHLRELAVQDATSIDTENVDTWNTTGALAAQFAGSRTLTDSAVSSQLKAIAQQRVDLPHPRREPQRRHQPLRRRHVARADDLVLVPDSP